MRHERSYEALKADGRDGTSPSGVALLRSRWRSEGIYPELSRDMAWNRVKEAQEVGADIS